MFIDPALRKRACRRRAYVVRVEILGRFVPGAPALDESLHIVGGDEVAELNALLWSWSDDTADDDTAA